MHDMHVFLTSTTSSSITSGAGFFWNLSPSFLKPSPIFLNTGGISAIFAAFC